MSHVMTVNEISGIYFFISVCVEIQIKTDM